MGRSRLDRDEVQRRKRSRAPHTDHLAPRDIGTSSLDPMRRLELQGEILQSSKRRLQDPSSPRRVRWGARIIVGAVVAPFVITFVTLLIAQLISLFGG